MIAAIFVLKLCAGITLMWWLMPRREVTDGFFRIQMRLLLGLAVLGVLLFASLDSTETPPNFTWLRNSNIAISIVAYFGSVFWAIGRRLPGNVCIYAAMILAVGGLIYVAATGSSASSVEQVHSVASGLASPAVAGSVLTGMLLGHWYLTTPSMSIQPLHWFNRAILICGIIRGLTLVFPYLMSQETGNSVWLSMTWAGAVVTPIIIYWMVRRILVHRNTQSATGVLFAGLILVFMGEMTAVLLDQAQSINT